MKVWTCPLCRCLSVPTASPEQVPALFSRCPSCGLFYQRARLDLEELLGLYPASYEPHLSLQAKEHSRRHRWALRRLAQERANLVERFYPAGSALLDLGCGTGAFLRVLHTRRIWQGMGLDVSMRAVQAARRHCVYAFVGTAEFPGLPHASFDVVTLWEVIEHLRDPGMALRQFWRLLRPKGMLIMSTPKSQSLQAQFWGPRWIGSEPARHLQVFPPTTLCKAVREAGFSIYGWATLRTEQYHAAASASNWLKVRELRREKLANMAIRLALWIAHPLLRLVGHSPPAGGFVLIAQREA